MADERDPDGYRAYAGSADQYDVIGAAQFALLYALGLREDTDSSTLAVDRCVPAGS